MDEEEILDDITKESGDFVAQMEQLSAFFKGLVTIKVDENLFGEVAILTVVFFTSTKIWSFFETKKIEITLPGHSPPPDGSNLLW